jgi:DNA repair photolyase
MLIKEINVKTALTKTGIKGFDYCLNPYIGCGHACRYCYASFMKRFTGHTEPWGDFVDVKINAPQVLQKQLQRAKPGSVLISTVTDPYQALEKKYGLTRQCLEALLERQFPVDILTRSPLVLRDIDLFRRFKNLTVGLSIGTDKEEIKNIFERHSPTIASRLEALGTLHGQGIQTYAFIGPLLPMDPIALAEQLTGRVDKVLIDRLNYSNKTKALYLREKMEEYLEEEYFSGVAAVLQDCLEKKNIEVSILFSL